MGALSHSRSNAAGGASDAEIGREEPRLERWSNLTEQARRLPTGG